MLLIERKGKRREIFVWRAPTEREKRRGEGGMVESCRFNTDLGGVLKKGVFGEAGTSRNGTWGKVD